MARAVEVMERDFQGIRTGRASTSLVERIHVDYYGTQTPLNQLAGISVPEAHQIVIQPWDRGVLGAIEKAIQKSDIGLVPNVDGTVVRLEHPAADRGAPPRHRPPRPQAHGRGPGRDPQPPPRGRPITSSARSATVRIGTDEVASRARGPAAPDRPLHRRDRPAGRPQGAGGPGGLVGRPEVRIPLARPTDAPPIAHAPRRCRGRSSPEPTPAEPDRDPARRPTCPVTSPIIMDGNRRWARERGLAELEGHAAGVEAIRELLRHAVRRGRPGPDPVRLQPGELGSLRRRGRSGCSRSSRRPSATRPTSSGRQGVRIRLLGRLDELPARHARLDRVGALAETAERRPAASSTSRSTTPAARSSSTPFRRLAASGIAAADHRRVGHLGAPSTRPACPIPTS